MTFTSKMLARLPPLLLLAVAAVFYALHFVHLTADFPNHSPWMDWAKYTDEGWYGDAAIRHSLLGHWYVPGDFNPAAALPVWPLAEALVFHFTGVSLVAARALVVAVLGGTLLVSYALLHRTMSQRWLASRALTSAKPQRPEIWPGHGRPLAPAAAVLLLAVSPFCFVFSRLAILEPPLILLTLLALLTASFVRPMPSGDNAPAAGGLLPELKSTLGFLRGNLAPVLVLGVLLPAMILTKTTALFLLPAIAWMLFAAVAYRLRALLILGVPAAALAAALWLSYFSLLVRQHLLLDYRYLFSANAYTGITQATAWTVIAKAVASGGWIDPLLYPLAMGLTVLAACLGALHGRRLREQPLLVTLALWAGGYMAFLAYHNNIQPRYYLVIAVPLTLLAPVALERLLAPLFRGRVWRVLGYSAAAGLVLVIAVRDAVQMLDYVQHPEYTLIDAAHAMRRYIARDRESDPMHSPLVLSISGSDLSLMTGLPSICDDFGTDELDVRVKRYNPGWYVAWNAIEDDKMDSLTPLYRLQRVATFPAMDDPDRNVMILYKLEDAAHTPPKPLRRPPVPRRMQTRVGQQPSTSQLEH